jgi:hypothetical protein
MWQDYLSMLWKKSNILPLEVTDKICYVFRYAFSCTSHYTVLSSLFSHSPSRFHIFYSAPRSTLKRQRWRVHFPQHVSLPPRCPIRALVCRSSEYCDSRTANEYTWPLWRTDNPVTLSLAWYYKGISASLIRTTQEQSSLYASTEPIKVRHRRHIVSVSLNRRSADQQNLLQYFPKWEKLTKTIL